MVKRWEELNREWVYRKYIWNIQKRDYRLPGGEVADYYIRVAKPGACVLAVTSDDKILAVRQYRPEPDAIFRELPGGIVEEGEDSVEAGMRELREETGFAGESGWVGRWYEDANTERRRHVVVVTNCNRVGDQRLDGREFLDVEQVPIAEFISQVRAGELTDAAGALLGLDHLGLLCLGLDRTFHRRAKSLRSENYEQSS